jgi:hypothetical protein
VSVDDAGISVGQLRLAAWFPGRPDFVDLGTGGFPRRLRADVQDQRSPATATMSSLASDASGNGTTDQRQWVLLLQAERMGTIMAASPIMIRGDSTRPTATRAEQTRDGRIQVGATPRESVVVTVKRPRRSPVWHRLRLVG